MIHSGIKYLHQTINLRWLIGASLLIATPFIWWPGLDGRASQMNFFQIGTVIYFASYLPLPVGIFTVFSLFNALFLGADPVVSSKMVQMIFMGSLYFYFVMKEADKHMTGWVNCLVFLAVLNCAFVILQAFKVNVYFIPGPETGTAHFIGLPGIMKHRIFSGILCATLAPLALKKHWILLIPLLVGLYYSKSTVAVVGFIAGLTWLAVLKKNIFFLLLVLGGLIFSVPFIKSDLNFYQFFIIYDQTLPLIKDHLLGQGLGAFHAAGVVFQRTKTWWREAHNLPYQIYFELGLAGLSLLIWLLFDVFKKSMKLKKDDVLPFLSAGFFAFFVSTLGQPSMHVVRIAMVGVTLTALIYARIETLKGAT